jgi:hypothetical protein
MTKNAVELSETTRVSQPILCLYLCNTPSNQTLTNKVLYSGNLYLECTQLNLLGSAVITSVLLDKHNNMTEDYGYLLGYSTSQKTAMFIVVAVKI